MSGTESAGLDSLLSEARILVTSITETDHTLDNMLRRANHVFERLYCGKEYHRGVESMLAATGKLDRRVALLNDLQKENRMIKSYQEENRMLRDQLEKSYATLDEIMNRHRQIMQRVKEDAPFSHFTTNTLESIIDTPFRCEAPARSNQVEKAGRLMEIMRYCELLSQRDTEMIARLAKENRVLRELLNYSSLSNPHILAHFRLAMQEYELCDRNEESEDDDEQELNTTHQSVLNVTTMLRPPQGEEGLTVDTVCEEVEDEGEEEGGEASTGKAIIKPPHGDRDGDADSGTASSLSSSPSSSDGSKEDEEREENGNTVIEKKTD